MTGTIRHIVPPPRFTLDAVGYSYGDKRVLDQVSCEISAGDFLGIVGPNGAGKTTLLRLLSGMYAPAAGTVHADGSVVHTMPAKARARLIAHVPQMEPVMFPWSVSSMVLLGRHPHSAGLGYEREEDFAAVRQAMERVEISHLAKRSVTDLSGGELHRVLIARALAQETPVLLLDEPNAHLDIHHQVALFDLLASLHADEGRTVVIITHDLNLTSMYCDRVMLLDEGRLCALGTPEDVLREDMIQRHFRINVGVEMGNGRPVIQLRRGGEGD